MRFGEKVLYARKELKMSRDTLAELAGVSRRTIAYYELEGKLPKQKSTVEALAKALHTTPDALMDDSARFVIDAAGAYGEAGARQAQRLVGEIKSLYTGGTLKEEDMDAMMLAIQDAYWIAKKKQKAKTAGGK